MINKVDFANLQNIRIKRCMKSNMKIQQTLICYLFILKYANFIMFFLYVLCVYSGTRWIIIITFQIPNMNAYASISNS